jgi:hypothetical protein
MRHLDHGYAVTSHSSQGLTAERVLVNIDSNVHPELINTRFAYVSVSRASHDAHIYTDDAASLGKNLSHDVTKSSAVNPEITPQPSKKPVMESCHGLRDLESSFYEAGFRQRMANLDIPVNNMPASMYAAQLPHEVIQQDIRNIQWGISQDVSPAKIKLNVIVEHWRRDGEHVPMVAHMYFVELQESVRKHPDFTPEQHIAALQPTEGDRQQWEPLTNAVNLDTADRFHWIGDNGSVQSYKHSGTGKYLHIDGNSGRFYDRDKNPITREAALEHALPAGHIQALPQAQDGEDHVRSGSTRVIDISQGHAF